MIEQRYTHGAAVLIAGGPSLTREQVEACRPLHDEGQLAAFGCNDAYRICDYLDVLYAADYLWIHHHFDEVSRSSISKLYTSREDRNDQFPQWTQVTVDSTGYGFSEDRTMLWSGHHGGYQLIQLAYLSGITTMLLIGYDGTSGGNHWFGPHPTPGMNLQGNYEGKWNECHDVLAQRARSLGVTIINCSPGSRIGAYPRLDLASALEAINDTPGKVEVRKVL